MSKPENPMLFEKEWDSDDNLYCYSTSFTLRDLFAGMAMQGMLAAPGMTKDECGIPDRHDFAQGVCGRSYEYADAMLRAREETE